MCIKGGGRFVKDGAYLAQRHLSAAWGFRSTRWSRQAEPRTLTERCTTKAKPNLRSFNLEAGYLEPQNAPYKTHSNGFFIVEPGAL